MSDARVFALDIGTHKIAGLLMTKSPTGFVIEHAVMVDQLPHAMRDGQIHEIASVAQVIGHVKEQLEKASGTTLTSAAVAAAGRSLRTQKAKAKRLLHPAEPLSPDDVKALELQAVAEAMDHLTGIAPRGALDSYLCVGCSVVQNYLDGEPIGSLIGHRGTEAEVEVIATFLPRVVIDSLATALEMADLEMASITLEPIAAMHVVVPPTMRMLNIALVDIGAGTSDIAVAAENTIKAYGMVSIAGDEMTEHLAQRYLLDLTVAETVKKTALPGNTVECHDAFGNFLTLSSDEVLDALVPYAQQLAEAISAEILALNDGPPKGVLLIGGGSQTPQLAEFIQKQLNLPANLVRRRERASLTNVSGCPEFSGPQVVTPVGIGCAHLDGITMHLITTTVNGRRIQLLKMPSSSVGDALFQAGYTQADLSMDNTEFFTISVGGRTMELPSSMGASYQIRLNGEPADLAAPIHDNDTIEVLQNASNRDDGSPITLADLVDSQAACYYVKVNGEDKLVEPLVKVNGHYQRLDYVLCHGDEVDVTPIKTVGQLLELLGIELYYELSFSVNGSLRTLSRPLQLVINGQTQGQQTLLTPGMDIKWTKPKVTLREILPSEAISPITVTVHGQAVQLEAPAVEVLVNDEVRGTDYPVQPGDIIRFDPQSLGFIVTDLFRVYQPNAEFLSQGGKILVNGQAVGFTSPLKNGDTVEFTV